MNKTVRSRPLREVDQAERGVAHEVMLLFLSCGHKVEKLVPIGYAIPKVVRCPHCPPE